jgi:hypothetical protein
MNTSVVEPGVELVLALDDETVREEFDALIEAVWVDRPPHLPCRGPGRARRAASNEPRDAVVGEEVRVRAPTIERERSPPG